MTEAEWNACTEPTPLLLFQQGKASDRKLRLFGVACCRRIWHRIFDPQCRHAVEVTERFIEGGTGLEEVEAARSAAEDAQRPGVPWRVSSGEWAAIALALAPHWHPDRWPSAHSVAIQAAQAAAQAVGLGGKNRKERKQNRLTGYEQEHAAQIAILRDIVGNPFRACTAQPAWLAWSDGAISKMAQAIYDARAFDRLPLLADALEEAGCADREILDHCRSGGEHVRGCWVVDLLLGKS